MLSGAIICVGFKGSVYLQGEKDNNLKELLMDYEYMKDTRPKPFTDETPMPFGVHKGKKMANVPADYLIWCYQQSWIKSDLKAYIEENMDVLKKETK